MSDFLGAGWSTYITLVTLLGIVWCIWLLFSQLKVKVKLKTPPSIQKRQLASCIFQLAVDVFHSKLKQET
jgi:hypothetical protein